MDELKIELQLIEDMIDSLEYVRSDIRTSELNYVKTVSFNELNKVDKKLRELMNML